MKITKKQHSTKIFNLQQDDCYLWFSTIFTVSTQCDEKSKGKEKKGFFLLLRFQQPDLD